MFSPLSHTSIFRLDWVKEGRVNGVSRKRRGKGREEGGKVITSSEYYFTVKTLKANNLVRKESFVYGGYCKYALV